MVQDTPHRRKSRIGPGLLLKRSVGHGSASTTASDAGHILFNSIRHDHDGNPLRRSQHQSPQDPSSGTSLFSRQQQQQEEHEQQHSALAPFQSISQQLEDPVDQLSSAVNQLEEKLAAVADIHAGLAYFNESFGAFLYGLKMIAEDVEWTEAPTKRSFERMEQREAEAIMLQQQQEELERIRSQQILEQQQEQERQRIEAERLEAERIKASLSNPYNSHDDRTNGRDTSRQRRPGTTGVGAGAKGKGVTASRIPARPNSSIAGASRVGAGGGVRKLVGKLVMKRMAERLPLRYRDEPHRGPIEAIMRSLAEHIEGQALPELVAVAGVARHRCNEYLTLLAQVKEVVKSNQKGGVLYSLNPDRYPSR